MLFLFLCVKNTMSFTIQLPEDMLVLIIHIPRLFSLIGTRCHNKNLTTISYTVQRIKRANIHILTLDIVDTTRNTARGRWFPSVIYHLKKLDFRGIHSSPVISLKIFLIPRLLLITHILPVISQMGDHHYQ